MPLRDVALTIVVFALLPLCFLQPWIGVLVWSWLGYMSPHRLTWAFAYAMPFAQLVAVATLAGLLLTRDRRPLPRTPETFLLLALWALFALSSLFARYPDDAWEQLVKVSKILLMTIVTLWLFQDARKLRWLVWVIAMSLGFFGLKGGIWAIVTGGQNQVLGPPGSFIEGNTEVGLAMLMTVPLLLFLRRQETRPWLRHFLTAMFAFTLVAIVFTYSRGAFLGLVAVILVLAVKSRLRILALALLVAGYLLADSVIPDKWFERMSTIKTYEQDDSAMGRVNAWYVAYRLALDHPLLGAGFRPFTKEVFDQYLPYYGRDYDAHSIYFQVLGEHGFTGLGLFLALLGSTLVSLRRLARQLRGDAAWGWIGDLAEMLQASLIGYAVSGAFLSLCYFDLYYHLVAITVLLKTLASAPDAAATPAPAAARPGLGSTPPRIRV